MAVVEGGRSGHALGGSRVQWRSRALGTMGWKGDLWEQQGKARVVLC